MNVVLLHSSLSSKSQWKSLGAALEPEFRVLAADLLGYGEAPAPAGADRFTLGDEVARVLALADARFGIGARFQLVGHSYGGAVALALARAHPGRVVAVAAHEPVCFNLLGRGDADRERAATVGHAVAVLAKRGASAAATRLFVDYWNGDGAFDRLEPGAQDRLAAAIAKVQLDFLAAFREPLEASAYATIRAPTLLVGGRNGPRVTRRILDVLGRALPEAVRIDVEGGHMAPISHRDAFNRLLRDFLLRVAAPTPLARAA